MLTCECDFDDYETYWYPPKDFSKATKKEKCVSCNEKIEVGSDCLQFDILSADEDGNECKDSENFMCQWCGDIFLNLNNLGYCINLDDNMHDLLKEYWQLTGFKSKKEKEIK